MPALGADGQPTELAAYLVQEPEPDVTQSPDLEPVGGGKQEADFTGGQ